MAEEFKIFLQINLEQWESKNILQFQLTLLNSDILCGPRIGNDGKIHESGDCLWTLPRMPLGPDFGFIIEYFDYVLVVLDKIDEAVEWFSLVIGNIIDATLPNSKIIKLPKPKTEL